VAGGLAAGGSVAGGLAAGDSVAGGLAASPASVDLEPAAVTALAFVTGPAGRPLLARAGDTSVWLSEPNPARHLRMLAVDGEVAALGAGDGLLTAVTATSVYRWEPASGREVDRREWHPPPRLDGLAVTDRSVVLVHSLDRLVVWDLAADQAVDDLAARPRATRSLAAAGRPDGRTLLAAGSYDGAVQLWDLGTREPLRTLVPHLAPVKAVALAVRPDGSVVVLSGDDSGTIRVWDADTGVLLAVRPEVGGPVAALAGHVQPDGGLQVAAAVGTARHTLLRWSTHPPVPAQRITPARRDAAAT
jgi:WD40 repeat protein